MSKRLVPATLITVALLILAGCSALDDAVPANTIEKLAGSWQQVNGDGSIRFYPDESVKLALPDENPPLKVLTALETMKDNQLAFSIGDRWAGPIRIKPAADWQSIDLLIPGEKSPKDVRTLHFVRRKP